MQYACTCAVHDCHHPPTLVLLSYCCPKICRTRAYLRPALFRWLGSNKLTGAIPAEIGKCVKLRNLHLYNNKLSGKIPATIGNLVNVKQM